MSDGNSALDGYRGHIVPRGFSPGFVVLSYLVSFVGAWTTLELINRRTAGRGLYNWALLIGSAISMGGVAIWCMHYIGNRAIILADGLDKFQIAYNAGFTALSFFVPIMVLLAAFLALGSNEKVSVVRIVIGGTMAGLGICGMHYLGQAGISNYTCIYQVGNVVGSAIIAIAASIMALFVFFVLRATWTASWWKRALTAIVLAGGVSGMHWLASVGTQYRLNSPSDSNFSRNSTVIVVIVLSISACLVLLVLTLAAQRSRSQSADRAQQVVLAAAIFDKEGKLMVNHEGLLPNTKMTNSYIERSFDDVFGISHPAFLWIFRASRNWSSVSSLLPSMRSHLNYEIAASGKSRINTKTAELPLTDAVGDQIEDYAIIFRELFCVAASELAEQFNEPLEKAGMLFDEILSTGQLNAAKKTKRSTPASSVDIERDGLNIPVLGRGQLLFLVRTVNRREVDHLQAAGFRFANVQNVVGIVGRSMQINNEDLARKFASMREYAVKTAILEPGVHLALFAIRASVNGGFDVLVRKDARNQLPTMQMPIESLDSSQIQYLQTMDGWSVPICLRQLKLRSTNPTASKREQLFSVQLHDTIQALCGEIEDALINDATLVAKPALAPCRGVGEETRPGQAQLIALSLIVPIHSRAPGTKVEFTPLTFFKAQQHVHPHSPDHEVFMRAVHREFAPVLNQAHLSNSKSVTSSNKANYGSVREVTESIDSHSDRFNQSSSQISLRLSPKVQGNAARLSVRVWDKVRGRDSHRRVTSNIDERTSKRASSEPPSEKHMVESQSQSFGGIMVSQEVFFDVNQRAASPNEAPSAPQNTPNSITELGLEMSDMGVSKKKRGSDPGTQVLPRMGTCGTASKEVDDAPTFVDELFAICVESR